MMPKNALTLFATLLGLSAGTLQAAESMDHSSMDHSSMPASSMPGNPMPGMDHSQMTGMDGEPLQTMEPEVPSQSRTPIPVLTDADRRAAFPPVTGHGVHDKAINSLWLVDRLEYQDADDGSALAWEMNGWIGGDIDRLWLRSEGERTNGRTENAQVEALWGHAIGPWWDVVSGVRQDFKPGAPQTWAALGLQGMALYNFESQATAYLGEGGQSALGLQAEYDILLTNRLILQPNAEVSLYGKNDPQRGIGSGLSSLEAGLRLRYELHRQFAPYVGVTWSRSYGKTADYAREEGEDSSEARLVLGVRLWF
ncbi:Copper resistance protein B [Pseudomonas chlororaphis subsp. aurantiaca]|uniref:copper resistance protein B n=1 Tax=Pseudomonas chlororaphis TaxID=587753 RepID=UPI000F568646|nr:copper resistance protein B [Pseudomonas chlororaphis]AZD35727.1 Copper resistance protein B [Pseudomonas chlororaphis subsp. aurantiaca]AZD42062.1 Copper resistance protein B [Pseudomonas chlororaphis subsp. aurantiaca]